MPGPYRAAAGKPYAVRKRPRRGQDPSLRTDPSTGAHTPPQVRAATRQRIATHVGGGVPDAPETSRCRKHTGRDKSLPYNQTFTRRIPPPPIPGKPPGRACPAPTARRWASPMPSANVRGGVKTPPYGHRPINGCPHPGRHICRPYSAYVNCIRRAGCPHPAASSRGHSSTGGHPRRGRRPRRPGNLLPPQTPAEGSRPLPTDDPSTSAHTPPHVPVTAHPRDTSGPGMPGPYRAAGRERRQKNRGNPFSRDCLGSFISA